ncbi:SusC/RagA family TonB-linked outer membrane protein [Puteibacter caeruleilacunae]|nr:SusC/RagA family TonB-linked outer membrane protein [Puteibacter caeruleilacunae]
MKKNQLFGRWDNYVLKKMWKIMRVGMLLLYLCMMQLYANTSYSQQTSISLNVKSQTVLEVIKEIEKSSNVKFFFSPEKVDLNRRVSLQVKDKSLDDVLDALFKGTAVVYQKVNDTVVLKNATKQSKNLNVANQSKSISGKITDEAGEPLPGVSVIVKGTTVGITSDFDGNYTLELPEGAEVIIYSFVGMKSQEIALNGQSTINVTMREDAIGLEEVVAIGYGIQKKSDLTGAVASVKGEELKKSQAPNLMNAMAGKMTGVIATQSSGQPGFDDPKFYVRGQGTLNNNSALTIVDGVDRGFARLDPDDIESITILKDAAATAVYGARAANGVILVTTKRGKVGKPTFNYSGSFSLQEPTRKPDLFNSYEYAKYYREAEINQNGGEVPSSTKYSEEDIENYRLGTDPLYPDTDWYSEVFNNFAPMHRHSLSVIGGTEKTKYYFSFGYLDQQGLSSSLSYNRYSIRSTIDTELSNSLSVSLQLYGELRDTKQPPGGLSSVFNNVIRSQPTEFAYVTDGEYKGELGFSGFGGQSAIGQNKHSGYNTIENNKYESSIEVKYDVPFIKGLQLKAKAAFDKSFKKDRQFEYAYDVYQYVRQTEEWEKVTSDQSNSIKLTDNRSDSFDKQYQFFINYNRKINDHDFGGIFVYEREDNNSSKLMGERTGYISNEIDQLFAGNEDLKDNNGSYNETVREGYVMRANYGYMGKYLLQVNGRYDGSYNFPKGSRWGFFPSASMAWRISEEQFLENASFLDNLKIRASYGMIGNDRVDAYQHLSLMNISNNKVYVVNGTPYKLINNSVIANPNITWETATNYDLGVDFAMFNGMISGELGGFYKRTEDILTPRNASIPETFGAKLPSENIGIVDLKGFEGLVNFQKDLGQVKLRLSANMTYSKNEVKEIDEPEEVPERIRKTGRSLEQRFGYSALGLFKSQEEIDNWKVDQDGQGNTSLRPGDIKYLDYNDDKVLDGKDIHHIGKSAIPEIVYGFSINADYKQFDISMDFQGAGNFEKYFVFNAFLNDRNSSAELVDSYRVGNEDARFPRMEVGLNPNNSFESDFWLYNASYLRLKNMQIGYTLRKTLAQKIGVSSARVVLSGTNLFTISDLDFVDPEAKDLVSYPQMRVYTLGVNIKF